MRVSRMQSAAMVLLGGWLWMQPPLSGEVKYIRHWEHVKSFDSARRCENAKSSRAKDLMEQSAPADEISQVLRSRCIPADYIYTPPYRRRP